MTTTSSATLHEPTVAEIAGVLEEHKDWEGNLIPGLTDHLAVEHRWTGRIIEILDLLTADPETMGYLAGGRHPDDVITWLGPWVESTLSFDQLSRVVRCGGWEPEPFEVLASEGILEEFLRMPDGSVRHVQGEKAAAWLCDQYATAGEEDVLAAAENVIAAGP